MGIEPEGTLSTVLKRALASFALFVAGCVSSDPGPTQTPYDSGQTNDLDASTVACHRRSGSFVTSYVEKYGTCGPYKNVTGLETFEEHYAEQPDKPPPPCTGVFRYSADNCTTTVETSCPSAKPDETFETKGSLRWNAEGTSASGELEVSTPYCKSTYRADVARNGGGT